MLQNNLEPGVLLVAIYEGLVGLSVPQYEAALEHGNDPSNITSQSEGLILPLSGHDSLPYATLELDGSEFSVSATSGTRENPVWSTKLRNRIHEKKFDIFRAAELTIRLYARNLDHREGSQDVFVGCAKMNPVFGDEVQTEWLPVKNGTGKLHVEVEYVKNKTLRIETSKKPRFFGESRLDSVARIQKSGSYSCYASIHIEKADLSPRCDVIQALLSPVNNGPFIAPLKFIAQTRSQFCLFWPFVSGGHLFYYLQRAQRFHADRARLYAAGILVALEWLDEVDPSYHELKPKNILLDSVGHVVVCDLGLLRLETKNIETTRNSAVDYLAPELLSGNVSATTNTTASKWWTLGAFLFEMLTGLPPFYDEDVEQRRRNILSEPLVVSGLLPASTQDLLNKLLTRKPDDRLGFNGACEIKAHRYFDGLDWDKVARREYEPAFKPHELAMRFKQEGKRETAESVEKRFSGFSWGTPTPVQRDPAVSAAVESHPVADEKTQDWELVWQREDQPFYFYNRSTKTKKPIVAARSYLPKRPDETQSQEALEAVLKNKYMHLVPTLLEEYSVNLNFQLGFAHTTPLDYVTGLQEVDMVRLFLANCADSNLEHGHTLGGRPLLSAVQKENQELVQMLVERTDRIPCTRALGHAVSKQDTPIVNILLANGVKCDFEEADRPQCAGNYSEFDLEMNATVGDRSEPEEYMPPLVRAINLGDADLVRLLLAHGANVNAGYHDLSILLPGGFPSWFDRIYMECGRPIQLAMELGHEDLARLLLENGADIGLAQPVWRHHDCKMIPREVHHQITARLRSIAASVA